MTTLRFPELTTAAAVIAVYRLHRQTAHGPRIEPHWRHACPTCRGLVARYYELARITLPKA